jgi:O-antigen/teichoic acid export membrane protein
MLNLGTSGSLRQHLIRGASGSLILKIANTALSLIMAVVLARMLGVENFGIYALCLSVVHILTVPAMLGGQQLLVREVAVYQVKGEFHFLRSLLRRFRQASLLILILLCLLTAGVSFVVFQDSPLLLPFLVAAALMPFVFFNLQRSSAKMQIL